MRKVAGITVLILLAVVIVTSLSLSREPAYQGQTLSKWLLDLDGHKDTAVPAEQALREWGTNILPQLVRMLDADKGQFSEKFRRLLARQPIIKMHWVPATIRRMRAQKALEMLGPIADPVAPQIARLLETREEKAHRTDMGVSILGRMGQAAIPFLVQALTNQHDEVRQKAAVTLARSDLDLSLATPALVQALEDPRKEVRIYAAFALGRWPGPPALVVPALLKAMRNDPHAVSACVRSLGIYGAEAREAIPSLLEVQASNRDLMDKASMALWRTTNGSPIGLSIIPEGSYRLLPPGSLGPGEKEGTRETLEVLIEAGWGRFVSERPDWSGRSGRFRALRHGQFSIELTNRTALRDQVWTFGTNGQALVITYTQRHLTDRPEVVMHIARPAVQ